MRKRGVSSALTVSTFSGNRPSGTGDLSVETHGIAPIPEDQRYGTPRRLFTVWFAPQVNMAGVFTGTLAIVLGLGFWLGLLAMVIGTVLGAIIVAYLSTWGPRTGAGQLPNSRMAFGGGVVLPAVLQLLSFVVFAVKLVGGHEIVTPPTVAGVDLAGAFILEVTIAFSFAISWASYAADFSRYLPANSSPTRIFGFTFAGIVLAYLFIQGIGIAAGTTVAEHTAEGT
jgi:nucleobase:cation symporter-1, NCS1 family